MSNGKKVAFGLWTLAVLIVVGGYLSNSLPPRTYNGEEIAFTAFPDWYIDVNSVNPVRIEAADSEYFQIVQGETYLYGAPETPPLGYPDDTYFRLEGELKNGRWEVVEGLSISMELSEEEPFSVTYSPTSYTVAIEIRFIVLIGFVVWLIGVLLGKIFL